MLLLVYICCSYYCRIDHKNIMVSYFASLDAIAAPEVTVSVSGKLHTSYNVLIMFMYVVIGDITDDIKVVFAT